MCRLCQPDQNRSCKVQVAGKAQPTLFHPSVDKASNWLAGAVADCAHAKSVVAGAGFNKLGKEIEACALPIPITCAAGANKPTLCPADLNSAETTIINAALALQLP